jgi:uncharacterized membrane protein
MKQLKNYLFTGLLVWLPVGLTIWIIQLVIHFVDALVPKQLSTEKIIGWNIPGIGLALAFIVLLITGMIAKNIFGQKLIQLWDKLLSHIPIVKSIYKGIKQVSDTLLSSSGNAFRKALLVRFPHQEAWTIAFITGTPSATVIKQGLHTDYINVYVPTTPNPTSGYFIIVHKADTQEIDMSVEEALRYVISMGTVDPTQHLQKPKLDQ